LLLRRRGLAVSLAVTVAMAKQVDEGALDKMMIGVGAGDENQLV